MDKISIQIEFRVEEKMKKVNPKVTAIAILLMTLLISGGIAVQETAGGVTQSLENATGAD